MDTITGHQMAKAVAERVGMAFPDTGDDRKALQKSVNQLQRRIADMLNASTSASNLGRPYSEFSIELRGMAYCGVHKTYEEFNSAMLGISAEVASIGVEVAKAGEDPWKKREYKNQQPPKREGMVNDDYMSHRLKEKEASGESEEDGGGQSNDNEDI